MTLPNGAQQTIRHVGSRREARSPATLASSAGSTCRRCSASSGPRPYFHDNSAATLEDVIRHYQRMFDLLTFFAERNLFAPPVNGQGCNASECGIRPLPDEEVPGLLAYLRRQ